MESFGKPLQQISSSSVDETINSLVEYSLQEGSIEHSYELDLPAPDEFCRNWTIGEPDDGPQQDPCGTIALKRALHQSHAREQLVYKRAKLLAKNQSLQKQVVQELRRRLVGAGKGEKEIEDETQNHLPAMVKLWYQTQNPNHKATKSIECCICTRLPGTVESVLVRVPINASLHTINDLLKAFVFTEMQYSPGPDVPKEEFDKVVAAWRYQLLARNHKGRLTYNDTTRIRLENDLDYRNMVKKVVGPDSQVLIPLLSPIPPLTLKQVSSDSAKAPLVDDGFVLSDEAVKAKQAFDEWLAEEDCKPVNWNRVVEKMEQGEDVTKCDLSWMSRGKNITHCDLA